MKRAIGTLCKIFSARVILIFESKMATEKLQVTEIHNSFGDKEIILSFQKQRFGLSRNGKEPVFATLLLPEYVSDQAVRLALSNFGKVVSAFNSRHK